MATLTVSISVLHTITGVQTLSTTPVSQSIAVSDTFNADGMTATSAGAVAVPLGEVTTPKWFYISNLDGTNFVKVLDVATVLEEVPAGEASWIILPAGLTTLNVQGDTADCLIRFGVYEAP